MQTATIIRKPQKIILAVFMVMIIAAILVASCNYYVQATRVQLRIIAAFSLTNLFRGV